MSSLGMGLLTAQLGSAGTGINSAVRGIVATPQGEVEAFVKQLADPRELLVECLCALLGLEFSLPVPPPLLVFVPPELGGPALAFGSTAAGAPNLSAFLVDGSQAAVIAKLSAWPLIDKAACFDEWIGNQDRHENNLLFDGKDRFWLIDHGLAVHHSLTPGDLMPANDLFSLAVAQKSEAQLLELRGRVLAAMDAYRAFDLAALGAKLPTGVWTYGVRDQVVNWLIDRQPHLLRLGNARIPAQQGDLLSGSGNG